jgi:YggT family protein
MISLNLYQLVDIFFQALSITLFIRIALSWFPHDPYHPIISLIYRITDPILTPFRQLIPPIGGLDISPIFAFMALSLIEKLIKASL